MVAGKREFGRRQLLDAIRTHGPVPRIELAGLTGISRATVTTITAEMIEQGLVEEVAPPVDAQILGRGRPRVDLQIRGKAHLVAGIKMTTDELTIMLMDFKGDELRMGRVPLPSAVNVPETLADILGRALDHEARQIGYCVDDISGIGLGISGIVDALKGFVHWSPSLTETNVELAKLISDGLNIPTYIDNDANLVALAEQKFGHGRGLSDFVVVTIESGVGLGVILNGELYRGARGCGAEFGHTKVQLEGALCRCGQRGCLEAYVADYALMREASLLMGGEPETPMTVQRLHDAAQQMDPMAQSILSRAGRMFAMGLANLINLFDPQVIILAGKQVQLQHLHGPDVIEAVRSSIIQVDKTPPEVLVHAWGDRMWALGAAAIALEHVADVALERMSIDVV